MAAFYRHVVPHSEACTHRTIQLNNSDSEPLPTTDYIMYRYQYRVHRSVYTDVPVPVR